MIPRIQGKVGQATEPEEMKGKWFFLLKVGALGHGEPEEFGPIGPWDSEEEAHKQLRHACRLLCEMFEKKIDGKVSGQYLDMKTNTMRRWDRKDEH